VAVASAGPCASLQTDNHTSTPPLSFFTGRMPFLPPNQQRRSTEGINSPTNTNRIQHAMPKSANCAFPATRKTDKKCKKKSAAKHLAAAEHLHGL